MSPPLSSSGFGERRVIALAWPICVSMLGVTTMGVIDMILVGRLGTAAIAAAGLSVSVSFVLLSFGNGLMHGVKVVGAQRIGAGDHDASDRLAWQSLWLALIVGVAIAVLAPFAPFLVGFLADSPDVARIAGKHLAIRWACAPLMFTMTGLTAFLQARERTRITMIGMLGANAVAIALDVLFLGGFGDWPGFGVPGAALASAGSWIVGSAILLVPVIPILRRTSPRPDPELLREVLRLGLPMGLQFTLDVTSFAVFSAMLARVGEVQLAAHVLAIRVISVSFLPGYAIGEAASVLVGQAIGARRFAEARQAWAASTRVALVVMLGWAVVFVLAPSILLSVFHAAPEVVKVATNLLYIAAMFQLFDGLATVAYFALTGAGDTWFAMVYNGIVAWLVKLPLAVVLAVPLGMGAAGAWLGLTAEIVVLAAVSVHRITSGRWIAHLEPARPAPAPEGVVPSAA